MKASWYIPLSLIFLAASFWLHESVFWAWAAALGVAYLAFFAGAMVGFSLIHPGATDVLDYCRPRAQLFWWVVAGAAVVTSVAGPSSYQVLVGPMLLCPTVSGFLGFFLGVETGAPSR